jgi:hypothetical protein
MCTTGFNIQQLLVLLTDCIYVFRMVLTINSDYFLKQHNQSIVVMEMCCVFFEVRTVCLNAV